jgi:hypothetical protein
MAKHESGGTPAEVRLDSANDTYHLGAAIDGAFVTFHTIDGPAVRGRIEALKTTAEALEAAGGDAVDE